MFSNLIHSEENTNLVPIWYKFEHRLFTRIIYSNLKLLKVSQMKGRIRSGEHEANVNEQERTVYSENEVQWANGGTRGVLGGKKRG